MSWLLSLLIIYFSINYVFGLLIGILGEDLGEYGNWRTGLNVFFVLLFIGLPLAAVIGVMWVVDHIVL